MCTENINLQYCKFLYFRQYQFSSNCEKRQFCLYVNSSFEDKQDVNFSPRPFQKKFIVQLKESIVCLAINTVKHLLFAWPYFRETLLIIYSRDFIFATHHIFFYNPYITNYWRGLYFRVSMLSRIYAKIKSSRIKSVLQYSWLINKIFAKLVYYYNPAYLQ